MPDQLGDTLSVRLAAAAVGFALAAFATALWPDNLYYIMCLVNAVLTASIAVAWPAATKVRGAR